VVANKESLDERVSKIENNIKDVKSTMKRDVKTLQSEARNQVSRELKQIEINKERLEQMNAELTDIKVKHSEGSTVVCSVNALKPTDRNLETGRSTCGSANNDNDDNPNILCNNIENGSGMNKPVSCANHMSNGSQSDIVVSVPKPQVCNANYFVAPSDLTLPYFNDSAKVNAIYHLRQLDEYMKLKAVPQQLQLAIALRSITDPLGVQWVSSVVPTIHNYEQFKMAFKRNFWSASKQSIVKCSIYQDRYRKGSDLSMSQHFLRYAVLASYLEPKMPDVELIDALKFHFSIYVQNAFAASPLNYIQDALDLLKRLEVIEIRENERRSNSTASSQMQNHGRAQANNGNGNNHNGNRPRPQNQHVRQRYVQQWPNYRNRGYDDRDYRSAYSQGPSTQVPQNFTERGNLKPAAPEFTRGSQRNNSPNDGNNRNVTLN
jgi:hypothetical protein